MNNNLAEDLEAFEQNLPEHFRTVVTSNTIAAEKEFLKQRLAKSLSDGSPVVTRMHVTWGPNAKNMTQQQLVAHLWEVENAPKVPVSLDELDGKQSKIDVRDFIKSL